MSEWELSCERCDSRLAVGDRGHIYCIECGYTTPHAYAVLCPHVRDNHTDIADGLKCDHQQKEGGK